MVLFGTTSMKYLPNFNAVSMKLNKTLGVIVIGDEILRGDVVDTNFAFVAQQAPSCGLKLKKVSIIPDVVKVISREIQKFSREYDVVVTSGGIGTTHDDLTFEAVADAFGENLVLHPSLLKFVETTFGCKAMELPQDDHRLRLARVPASSRLIYGQDPETCLPSEYPVLTVRNVFVLPGLPPFFQLGFTFIKPYIRDPNMHFFDRNFYSTSEETHLAKRLSDFAMEFKESVLVGSYPVQNNRYYKVRISLESQDKRSLEIAQSALEKLLGNELVAYDPDPVSSAAKSVYGMAEEDSDFGQKLKHSIELIEKALQEYGTEDIVLSFNGGKDCTVVLHLLFAVLNKATGSVGTKHPRLFYVRAQTPFPEVETFVQSVLVFYKYQPANIAHMGRSSADSQMRPPSNLIVYDGTIKEGLARLKKESPNLKAVFVGTRFADPQTDGIVEVMPTDPGWPEFIRVHPILQWDYADVWKFIRSLSLPYCSLYDVGYTSLGGMEDTHPNPELRSVDSTGRVTYQPAYTLKNFSLERSGRATSASSK
uniref:FAD synthase n=1 Tax=Echinococcus granulosus TaxID=6210 RepID=A0A068WRG0_ECHGR|nr:fad synthase [Echinococcus granulosus]